MLIADCRECGFRITTSAVAGQAPFVFWSSLRKAVFARAAERCTFLNRPLPANSKQLEDDLADVYFERTSAGVRPTSGGPRTCGESERAALQITIPRWPRSGDWFVGDSDRLRIGYVASAVAGVSQPRPRPTAPHASQGQNQNAGF